MAGNLVRRLHTRPSTSPNILIPPHLTSLLSSLDLRPSIVSSKILSFSPDHPASIIDLLLSYGVSNLVIKKVIRNKPDMLCMRINVLTEKLEFLRTHGFTDDRLNHFLSSHPTILALSLANVIAPTVNLRISPDGSPLMDSPVGHLLLSFGVSKPDVLNIIRKKPMLLSMKVDELREKLEFLRANGFADDRLSRLLLAKPAFLSQRLADGIEPTINFLRSLGQSLLEDVWRCPGLLRKDVPDRLLPNVEALRRQGMPEVRIKEVIASQTGRAVLFADPDQFAQFLANFEFLRTHGFTDGCLSRLSWFLAQNPSVLSVTLVNEMAPAIKALGSLFNQKLLNFICLDPSRLQNDVLNKLVPNVEAIRQQGMPDSNIKRLFGDERGKALLFSDHERFVELVAQLKEMGYDLQTKLAVRSLLVLSQPDHFWHTKLRLLQSLGWSGEDILTAFRQYPECFLLSEDNIRENFEFLVNKLHWTPTAISQHPQLLKYSVKGRIIPRVSVFNAILSAGLASRAMPELNLFARTDFLFIEHYVKKYQDEVPNIWDAYHGRLELISSDMESNIEPNIQTLKKFKVPDFMISRLVHEKSRALLINYIRFENAMKGLKGMQFQFSSKVFPDALVVLGTMWDAVSAAKLTFYRNLGWTDLDIVSALKMQPYYLTAQDAKVRLLVKFFKAKLKWGPSILSKFPDLLLLDFEKVIMPRYAIFIVLLSNRCVRNNLPPSFFLFDDHKFYKWYVDKFKHRVPGLLEIFQSSKS